MSKVELEITDLAEDDLEEITEVVTEEFAKEDVQAIVKKQKKNSASNVLILAGLLCIGIALYGLYDIYRDYKTSDSIYEQAIEEYVQIYVPEGDAVDVPWYEYAWVDIVAVQQENPDVIGWIMFEDGSISYPIVQGDDNDKYLHMTYDGKEAKAGSIFMDANDNDDFSDTHTIIYGHNMKNLSMFGKLKYYKTQKDYYDGHKYFLVFRGNEILRYQIFSYQEVPDDSYIYQEEFTSAKQLADRLQPNSMVDAKLDISDENRIITLSTCTAADDERFIVNAVLVERYNLRGKKLFDELNKE